jgi:sec-independent protein translocase protein TatC
MMMAFGVCFQLPVIVFFLARLGLVDARDLIKGFRYAVVAIFVVAALITPPEVLTQMLLAAPLVLLYGVGIGVAWLFSTKQRVEEP